MSESEDNLKFESTFKIAVSSMRLNGSYPFSIRNKLWLTRAVFITSVNLIILYLLTYTILFHDLKKGKFTDACKNIAMLIVNINTTMKYVTLLHYKESIISLIQVVDDDYELVKQLSTEDQNIMKKYARESRFVCLFWFVCTISGSGVFPLKALIQTANSFRVGENELIPMFQLSFPEVFEPYLNTTVGFCGFFTLCLTFAFLASLMFVGCDPLIPIFTMHTCAQLDLLTIQITNALSVETLREKENNMRKIIIKLQKLYSFINRVQSDFSVLNEFNMKATTIFVPLVAFNIIEELRVQNLINYEYFILAIGATIHFLIPCYFSDKLMERSAAFRQAIYSCGWERHADPSVRLTVLIMMTRAARPLGLRSVFYVMSLDTFASMTHQAYGLFNLMNAAWRE